MRHTYIYILLAFLLQSCWHLAGDDDNGTYESQYEPIAVNRSTFENSILVKPPQEIQEAGKIYVKDHLIFINEVNRGFHVLNNLDPKNPKPMAFIEIPLATDLAIRNSTIYAHHAVDLVAFSFNNNTINIFHRERNVFPRLASPDGFNATAFQVAQDEIIIGYRLKN